MTTIGRSVPPSRQADAGPVPRVSGRQLAAGIGLSAGLAGLLCGATALITRAVAPGWAHTEGLTVLIVAEVYLAVIAGLTIAVGGPAGLRNQLALHRPRAGQIGWALAVLALAVLAALVVSVAFSPLSGGVPATLRAIVQSGSDETRSVDTLTPGDGAQTALAHAARRVEEPADLSVAVLPVPRRGEAQRYR